jgi:VWA domain-containing protein
MITRLLCALLAVAAATLQPPTRFVLASVVDLDGAPVVGLAAEDFVLQEGATLCETVAARPAEYPIAVLVDTSQAARTSFSEMRKAIRQLIARMSGREVALYTFGDRAFRAEDVTRNTTRLEHAVDQLFALPEGESHVLDAIIEAGRTLKAKEAPVSMIVVVSAGGNDQSSRTPREVFDQVLGSRSIVHIVEMRAINASGRLNNVRGRRNFTSDRAAEAALGLQELQQALVERTRGDYDHVFSASGYHSSLERLQQRLQSELVIEYASPGAGSLQIGTRLPRATVRAVGIAGAADRR